MPLAGALVALLTFSVPAAAQAVCDCDPMRPDSLHQRHCSLCAEAEKHSSGEVFFLRDINPRKPNRWLALPRQHSSGQHHLHEMSPAERTVLWEAAIRKGIELWGEGNWGAAYNGPQVRTQCHAHIHLGKFITLAELNRDFIVVSRPEEIPAPAGQGVWIHPVAGKIHVHLGEQITETVLAR